MNPELYGQMLKQWRADHNLTQIKASVLAGISLHNWRNIEQGSKPGARTWEKIKRLMQSQILTIQD